MNLLNKLVGTYSEVVPGGEGGLDRFIGLVLIDYIYAVNATKYSALSMRTLHAYEALSFYP